MIDPMTSRLAQVYYQERLQAAEAARQRRATWVAAPSPIDRLRQVIGKQLIILGQRVQAPVARTNVYR
jgi:hypothetical protein